MKILAGFHLISILFISMSIHGAQPLKEIAVWDFKQDADYVKQKLKTGKKHSPGFSFKLDDALTIKRNNKTDYPGNLIGRTINTSMPRFFLIKANVKYANTSPLHTYSILLRGTTNDGQICQWKLALNPTTKATTPVYQEFCQAPNGIKDIRLYLILGVGELKINSIRIIAESPPEDNRIHFFSDEELLIDPGFKSKTSIQRKIHWICSDKNFKLYQDKTKAVNVITVNKGYLRQLKIPVHFPGNYILSFQAKFKGTLNVAIRGKGNFSQKLSNTDNQWHHYQILYPVLQKNCDRIYINFQGTEYSLCHLSFLQTCPDQRKIEQEIKSFQAQFQKLAENHPQLLKNENKHYNKLTESFDNDRLHPYIYWHKLNRLLKKAKLKVIVF